MAQAFELGAVGGEDLSEEEKVQRFLEQARQAEEEEKDLYKALFKANEALKLVVKMQGKNSAKYKEIRAYIKRLERQKPRDESDEDGQDHGQDMNEEREEVQRNILRVSESSTLKELVHKLLTSKLSTCYAEESIILANHRYTKEAKTFIKEKKYAEAVQSFASAISHQFNGNATHDMILDNCWNLVEALMQHGRLQEAQKLLETVLEYFSLLTSRVWKLRMLYLLACLSALLGDRDKEYQCYEEITGMLRIKTGFAEGGQAFLCAAVSAAYRNRDVDLSLGFQQRARTYGNRVVEIRQAEEIGRFLRSFERVGETRRTSQIADMLRFIEDCLPRRPITIPDSIIDQKTLSLTTPAADQSSHQFSHQSSHQSPLLSLREEQLRSSVAVGGIRQPAPGLPSTEAGNFMDYLKSPEETRQPSVNRPVQGSDEQDGTENANINQENRVQSRLTRGDALSGLMENLTELRDLLPADILSQEREMDNSAEEVTERIDQLSLEDASEEQISHMQMTTAAQDVVFKNEKTDVNVHSDEKIEEINQEAGAAEKLMDELVPIAQSSSITGKKTRSGYEHAPLPVTNHLHYANHQVNLKVQRLRIFSDLKMQTRMAQFCRFIHSGNNIAESWVTLKNLQDVLNRLNDSLAMGGNVKAAGAEIKSTRHLICYGEEAQQPTDGVDPEPSKIAASVTPVPIPEEKPQKEGDVNLDELQQLQPVAATSAGGKNYKSADDGERLAGSSGNFGDLNPVTEANTNKSERLQNRQQFKEEVHSLQTEMKKLASKFRNPQHREIVAMVTDYSIVDDNVTTTGTITVSINEFGYRVGTAKRKLQDAVQTPNDDSDILKQAINLLDQTERRIVGIGMPQN